MDSSNFPAASTIAAAIVEIDPGGMRELHWHPNADEWQFYISGKGRMTVFSSGKARTFDYQAGDVGYIPFARGHYVENTGDEVLRYLEIFRSPRFAYLAQSMDGADASGAGAGAFEPRRQDHVEVAQGQAYRHLMRRNMSPLKWLTLPWVLYVAGVAFLGAQLFDSSRSSAQQQSSTLEQEIADIERQIDGIEGDALAGIPSLLPGSPQRIPALGKILFFDKELSVNRNEACAFCHMPQSGYQGAIESINLDGVAQPGSVRTRFSLRKPPSAAYAALSPPLFYADEPGEAKCVHCFIGGNFWDLRATGLRLQNPTAMQAEGSPLNPTEMANPDPACVVRSMSQRPYRELFESIWGPRAFAIAWPENIDAICRRPNDNPSSAIGSEVPGPNNTPEAVALAPEDRARAQSTFDQMAESIAAFEASPEVSPFSSKFDAFLAGNADLSPSERRGYDLFNGQAKCANCHVDAGQRPLFTDNSTANLGVPRNPALSFYRETQPDEFGYVTNGAGQAATDLGVGNFLRSPETENTAWKVLAPDFDGRFRVPTLRNVDKRPRGDFVKAHGHNGYFKSLKEIVHFYNTRDKLPKCAVGAEGEKVSCWPPPETPQNLNTTCCNLGLLDQQEDDIVAFLKTLTDGYTK